MRYMELVDFLTFFYDQLEELNKPTMNGGRDARAWGFGFGWLDI